MEKKDMRDSKFIRKKNREQHTTAEKQEDFQFNTRVKGRVIGTEPEV
jgi:hypothetical protein